MKTLLLVLLLLTGLAASAQKSADCKTPESFAHTVLTVCKKGTAKKWQTLLSERFASRGNRFVKNHFTVWRTAFGLVIKQYPQLQNVPVNVENETRIQIGGVPVIVQKQDGRYYIDEL